MQGQGQLKVAEGIGVTAANVLGMGLDALLAQPIRDLGIADDGRPGAPGDGDGITQVVIVSVRDQDVIGTAT